MPKVQTPPQSASTSPKGSPTPKSGSSTSMWRRVIITVVCGALAIFFAMNVFMALARLKSAPPRENPPPVVLKVEAFETERIPVRRFFPGFGTVQPDTQVTVSAEVSGRITEKSHLEVGVEVKGPTVETQPDGRSRRTFGDILVQIDSQVYQERVAQTEAQLRVSHARLNRLVQEKQLNEELLALQERQLALIRGELERAKELLSRGAGSQATVDQEELDFARQNETVKRLRNTIELIAPQVEELTAQTSVQESELSLARQDLEKATVRAGISGIISEVHVEQGQYVRAGDPIVELTAIDRVEVPIGLPLEDAIILGKLLGQGKRTEARLATRETDLLNPARPSRTGYISRVNPQADEKTRTVQVFVEVDNREQSTPLKPGVFVYARIDGGILDTDQGLLIPREAINGDVVFVVNRDQSASADTPLTVSPRKIRILQKLQSFALVDGEIAPGDQIVTSNLDILSAGSLLDVRQVRTLRDETARLRIPYLEFPASQATATEESGQN
ncbi:Multidrug resistance protein MdtA precursor [Thalassoglobus neptunius]|uniref:Multidrug resistance protein MdtA n=1 Tax=Thalassoglobus neptunius TaxID=1938619 RepID=A0A5C5X3D4_9PLAN|nr:efflux RND transporter periplasmic adaptor subunit [Thalassoglobus neptunius]TWT57597.1 Multidrug resistance protein MdtA precursor [Thalassoglobus neptunius]